MAHAITDRPHTYLWRAKVVGASVRGVRWTQDNGARRALGRAVKQQPVLRVGPVEGLFELELLKNRHAFEVDNIQPIRISCDTRNPHRNGLVVPVHRAYRFVVQKKRQHTTAILRIYQDPKHLACSVQFEGESLSLDTRMLPPPSAQKNIARALLIPSSSL